MPNSEHMDKAKNDVIAWLLNQLITSRAQFYEQQEEFMAEPEDK